jgi:hypothetical protein
LRHDPARVVATDRPLAAIVLSVPFWSLMVVFSVPPLFGFLAITQHALYFPARGISVGETSLMLAAGGVAANSQGLSSCLPASCVSQNCEFTSAT